MKSLLKKLAVGLVVLALVLALAEVLLRLAGYGRTPKVIRDASIEYLFAPDQLVRVQGKQISYNAFSMRSQYFPRNKWIKDEVRVLVLGDSVVNGGLATDQSELATELLRSNLQQTFGARPVVVGNASAGSWGPANQLAYLKRFGHFDADVVVAVWSSADIYDVPLYGPLLPAEAEPSDWALGFLWQKALHRILGRPYGLFDDSGSVRGTAPDPQMVCKPSELTAPAIELIQWLKSEKRHFVIVRHPVRDEAQDPKLVESRALLSSIAADNGVEVVELQPYLDALPGGAASGYRDIVHLNVAGQTALAKCLQDISLKTIPAR